MEKPAVSWSTRLKRLMPVFIAIITKLLTENVGGFRLRVLQLILNYGGRSLINTLSKMLDSYDRGVAQKKATEKKDQVVNDPNSTPEQEGEAYEDMFNAGRTPRP